MKSLQKLRLTKSLLIIISFAAIIGSCECAGPRHTHDENDLKEIVLEELGDLYYKEDGSLRDPQVLKDLNYGKQENLNSELIKFVKRIKTAKLQGEKSLTDGVHKGARIIILNNMFFYLDPKDNLLGYMDCRTNYPFMRSIKEPITSRGKKQYFMDLNDLDDKRSLYMNILMVHPDHRRSGVASKLQEVAEERAKKLNKDSIVLYTWNKENQSGAYDFYHKKGFIEICKDDKTVYMNKKVT